MVRDPEKLGDDEQQVEAIQGDVSQIGNFEETIRGTVAVLSTLPPIMPGNEPAQSARRMEDMVDALERNSIKRFIHIGGAVHGGGQDEHWTLGRRLLGFYLNIVCKPVLIAKQLEWEVLKNSNLDWTLVRPPQIVDGISQGQLVADEKNLARTKVNVEDLANFMLAQITSGAWIEKAPLVSTVPD